MLNITLSRVRLHIEGRWSVTGSVFRQTRRSIMDNVSVDFDIESDTDPNLIAATLRNATNGCHAESALRDPTHVSETVRLNGDAFDVDAYPATTVQRA